MTTTNVPQYEIAIPDDLPSLKGSFSRKQRVEVALDVIATLQIEPRKFVLTSTYFAVHEDLPSAGQLNSSVIKGECHVCARGMLFIKSLDRFNSFLLEHSGIDVEGRTADEWGEEQADSIEAVFEGYGKGEIFDNQGGFADRRAVLIAVCENIVSNHGEFLP